MSNYGKNIAALREAFPGFQQETEARYSPSTELEIRKSAAGLPTAKLDGRYLHSARDPMREAQRAVNASEELRRSRICVFLGFGLGYHVEAYLEAASQRTAVVVEKDPALFLQTLQHRDFTALFRSGQLTLLLDAQAQAIPPLLGAAGGTRIALFDIAGRCGRDGDYYTRVRETVINYRSRGEVNTSTLTRFGKLWVRNLAHNLPLLPEAEDVGKLQRLFEGMPILVVAAGPSLDELLPILPQLAARMPVVAVDTALGALRRGGVEPDMLTVVDPQYWNTRHLDRRSLTSTLLISESSTHPIVFRRSYGRLFFGGSVFPLGQFLETENATRFRLGAGGSVATTAWDLARVLGASTIYMAGLDLGFPDARTHYTGSFFEERLHQQSSRLYPHESALYSYLHGGAPFKATNNTGSTTLTDKRLVVYTKWFEEQLTFPSAPPTYNLSPKGIAIEGMQPCAAERLLHEPLRREDIEERIHRITRDPQKLMNLRHRELAQRVKQLSNELERISTASREAEELTARLLDPAEGSEPQGRSLLITRLEEIDRELISSRGKEVVGFLLQGFLDALPDDSEVPTTEWLSISARLYRQLADAADYHIRLFQSAAL